ncbi:hypothetical protein [Lutimonas sp.]|uniref:hypothetical protein n=1 Tax=Lutimonas sp. TaxID=1872403 RepID=UPI003C72C1CC
MKFAIYFLCCLITWFSGYTQHIDKKVNSDEVSPLFKDEKPLKIHLTYSKEHILSYTNDSSYIKSDLSYQKEDGMMASIETEVRARGNYRRSNCYYLPLWIKINKEASQGSIFQDDKKLKLVLPCLNSSRSNDDVLKEFLAYKIYELISPYHFDTKLLSIQLKEEKKGKNIDHDLMGIFIQDDKKTASIHQGNLIKRHIHPNNQDPLSSARNAMFQYMIGNTDYSIAYQHNEKLFFIDDKIVPIPYDFDMSGLVNASYAVVSAINNKPLPISKVTDRLYRGFDRDDEIIQEVRNEFLNHEIDNYNLMDQYKSSFKYPKEFTECKSYVESFYKIIKDDKKFENRILKRERTKLD